MARPATRDVRAASRRARHGGRARQARATAVAALAAALAATIACSPSEEELRAREEALAARAADSILAIASADDRVFRGAIDGRPLALAVHECQVWNLDDPPRSDGRRPALVKPDFYPWPTACQRQSIAEDSGWVVVTLGRMGFGAGGCCATGGTWRTRDGRAWERDVRGKWAPVVPDSAAVDSSSDSASVDSAIVDSADDAEPGRDPR